MAKRKIYLSGEEFVKKLYEGEKTLQNIELPSGTNLLLVEGFNELREKIKNQGVSQDSVNLSEGSYQGIVAPEFLMPYVIAYDADFSGAVMPKSDFRGGQFGGAIFNGAYMGNSIFSQANLNHVSMKKSSLTGAILTRAKVIESDLEYSDFSRTDLRYSDFTGSCVEGVKFDNSKVEGMKPPSLRHQINPNEKSGLIKRILKNLSQ